MGFKLDKIVLSYKVLQAQGKYQTAARIQVYQDESKYQCLFDTGFTDEIDSLGYELKIKLESRTRYFWSVSVRTDAGEETTSDLNWFETGKMNEEWEAKWITNECKSRWHPVYYKKFSLDKKIKSARLYICGLGLYQVFIDEKKISDEYFTPYSNDYQQWLQYQTYDITNELAGGGELAVLLGNGWYKGRFGYSSKINKKPYFSDRWKLIAEIRVVYSDDSEEIISTDESWQIRDSYITESSIYDGEYWDTRDYINEKNSIVVLTEEMPVLTERLSTAVKIREELKVQEVIKTPAGELVLDIGQNIAGIFKMLIDEPEGAKVHLQFGEILQDGNFYRGNLRSAKAEFIYISDGKKRIIQPHFTYYGYRYVKVTGVSNFSIDNFTALVLYSELPQTGNLNTGSPLVNRLVQNTEWSLKGNFIDVPTDCPQRDERMGWTGDAQVFCPTALFMRESYVFYRKYLYDIWQEQIRLDGQVPNVVPSVGHQGTSAVWGDAACIIPWNLYLYHGDKSILDLQYESMRSWVDYITKTDGNNRNWGKVFHFGDWLALDKSPGILDQTIGATDTSFIAYIYYANSAEITAKSAKILGKAEDAEYYFKLAESIYEMVRKEYYSSSGKCCIDTQTAYLLTLHFDILHSKESVREALINRLESTGYRLETGFVGTPLLCNQLSEEGFSDLAYKLLLNEEYPGWLYEVKLGATTIWERWNSVCSDGKISSTGMNSLNHYAYGSIVEWLFRHGAGINPVEEAPGFRKAFIKPEISWEVQFLEAEYKSAAGTYKSAWYVIDPSHIKVEVTVPFGCQAMLKLPLAEKKVFSDNENPLFSVVRDDVCYIGPGSYSVTYETIQRLDNEYNIDTKISILFEKPLIRKMLRNENAWIQKIPPYEYQQTLKQAFGRYGSDLNKEDLMKLDERLRSI